MVDLMARRLLPRESAVGGVSTAGSVLRLDDDATRLLELQRTAGNSAVVELVAPAVQRLAGPGDEAEEEATTGVPPETGVVPAEAPDPDPSPGSEATTKKRTAVRGISDTHLVPAADRAAVPSGADRPALVAEWIRLDALRKEKAAAKEPFDPKDAARLAEVNRLLHLRRKADAADTLAGNGYKDGAAAWYADVKETTFLGKRIRVHRLLADRLDVAETAFLASVVDQPVPEGGWVRSTSTLRDPEEGLHGLGLAIDLNPGTNPYLINPSRSSAKRTGEPLKRSKAIRDVIDRAVLLVLNRTAEEEDFSAMPDLENIGERVQASHTKLTEASAALRTYLTLAEDDNAAELERLIVELGDRNPRGRSADQWRRRIRKDLRNLRSSAARKDWINPTAGFIDLPWELVKALTDTGLTWLGDNTIGSGRDIMHFDMRGLGPVRRIYNSEKDRWTSLG